jgi:PIN domain nuclease of toxin-antitoxin system
MKLLIDTHVALWLDSDTRKLKPRTLRLLSASSTEVWLSTVSCAEMGVKIRRGKLRLDVPLGAWVDDRVERYRWRVLDLQTHHTAAVVALPTDHRDPFDLLLAAQSIVERMRFVTGDGAFAELGVDVVAA